MKRNAPFLKVSSVTAQVLVSLIVLTLVIGLQLYTPYIQNFERATKALEEATKKSSNFEKMIREFEVCFLLYVCCSGLLECHVCVCVFREVGIVTIYQ